MFEKIKRNGLIGFLVIAVVMLIGCVCVNAKNAPEEKTSADILSEINSYQESYFTIIKRNNVLLNFEDDKDLNKDRKELKKLYKEVNKQIANKEYLKKYKETEKHYAKCDEITTPGINNFAENHYNAVDALLNDVYAKVKSKISSEDFKNLAQSETEWLKEVGEYKKAFDSMDFGTIGTSTYYDYQTDMKRFRTLLLMLYL